MKLNDAFLAAALERTGPLRLTESEVLAYTHRAVVIRPAAPDSTDLFAEVLPDDPVAMMRLYCEQMREWPRTSPSPAEKAAVLAEVGRIAVQNAEALRILLSVPPPLVYPEPPSSAPSTPAEGGEAPEAGPGTENARKAPSRGTEAPSTDGGTDAASVTQRF